MSSFLNSFNIPPNQWGLYLLRARGWYLRAWLRGSVFFDDSPDERIVNGLGTMTAGNLPAPEFYEGTKTLPFDAANYGRIDVAAQPQLIFGSADFQIEFDLRNTLASGEGLMLFQRGAVNGGFGSDMTLYVSDNAGRWQLNIRGTDPGVQMIGSGVANNPPLIYAFQWDTADIPTVSTTFANYRFRRVGARVQASYNNGPWKNPDSGWGAAALPSSSFALASDAAAIDTPFTLINRQAQAYTYTADLREYKIYSKNAPAPFTLPSYWNPDDKGANVILSNGNKTALLEFNNPGAVRGGVYRASNSNRYFEIEIPNIGDVQSMPGVGLSLATLNQFPGIDGNAIGYFGVDGKKYTGGVGFAYGSSYAAARIGCALINDSAIFYLNGVSQGVAYNVNGTFFPMWGAGTGGTGDRQAILHTYASEMLYLPSGVLPWIDGSP